MSKAEQVRQAAQAQEQARQAQAQAQAQQAQKAAGAGASASQGASNLVSRLSAANEACWIKIGVPPAFVYPEFSVKLLAAQLCQHL